MHRKAEVKAIITEVINNMSEEEDEDESEGDDAEKSEGESDAEKPEGDDDAEKSDGADSDSWFTIQVEFATNASFVNCSDLHVILCKDM